MCDQKTYYLVLVFQVCRCTYFKIFRKLFKTMILRELSIKIILKMKIQLIFFKDGISLTKAFMMSMLRSFRVDWSGSHSLNSLFIQQGPRLLQCCVGPHRIAHFGYFQLVLLYICCQVNAFFQVKLLEYNPLSVWAFLDILGENISIFNCGTNNLPTTSCVITYVSKCRIMISFSLYYQGPWRHFEFGGGWEGGGAK